MAVTRVSLGEASPNLVLKMSPFIRAHGYIPGPTQRPVTAGLLAGLLALAPSLPIAWLGDALSGLAGRSAPAAWFTAAFCTVLAAAAGAAYGRIFMRAANDSRGGWLFGISFGFLLWMIGPVAITQWVTGRPAAVDGAARYLFVAHLAYGVALGGLFPHVHRGIRRRTLTASPTSG